ncbi:MAG: pentapeptide repeat-containing protein [Rhodospirillaceae bacterium]
MRPSHTVLCAAALIARLVAPGVAAAACGDLPGKPSRDMSVLRTPAEAAALPAGPPVLAWIGPDTENAPTEPAEWSAATLKGLRLAPGSVISDIQVAKAMLAGWSVPGVRFVKVDLTEANLAGADLTGACFDHVILEKVDFSGAKLGGAVFDGAALAGARFDGADLSDARLSCLPGVISEGCYSADGAMSFRGADLRRADIARPLEIYGGSLEGAQLDRTTLALSDSLFESLAKTRLTGIVMVAPALRSEAAEPFTAAELARLKQVSGGRLTGLFREIGAKPSFDCAAPKLGPVEQVICGGGDLSPLDQLMSLTYRRRLDGASDASAVKTAQLAFLKKRNACAAVGVNDRFNCVFNAYLDRLTTLGRDFVATIRPPARTRLEARPAVALTTLKSEPLVERVLRAYGSSLDNATLESRGEAIALEASSLGGNGHSCNFEGELKWDAAKGIWAGGVEMPMSWLILPDGIAIASSPEEAREWCGLRASWPEVYFVPPK